MSMISSKKGIPLSPLPVDNILVALLTWAEDMKDGEPSPDPKFKNTDRLRIESFRIPTEDPLSCTIDFFDDCKKRMMKLKGSTLFVICYTGQAVADAIGILSISSTWTMYDGRPRTWLEWAAVYRRLLNFGLDCVILGHYQAVNAKGLRDTFERVKLIYQAEANKGMICLGAVVREGADKCA